MTGIELIAPLAGWVMPLAEVADPVFAEGMMGGGVAIEPVGDVLHAPCAATVLSVHAARHAVTLAAADGLEILMHIGIDSVAMAGDGFAALVAAGDTVAAGDPLIRFDLDRLATGASAAATPIIVASPGASITLRGVDRLVAVGEPLMHVTIGAASEASGGDGDATTREAVVGLAHGLHARPAARLVAALRPLDAQVTLSANGRTASAASSVALLGLGIAHGAAVTIEARGDDAAAAAACVAMLLERDGEATLSVAAPPPSPTLLAPPAGAIAGVAAAPGLALGPAVWLRRRRPAAPERGAGVAIERGLLARGLLAVRGELAATAAGHGEAAAVFAAHREILDDPTIEADALAAIDAGSSAAAAILVAGERQAAVLRAAGDARIAERADDITDVAERVAHAILGSGTAAAAVPGGAILLADDLLPSQFAALDAGAIGGIALVRGGPTAHVAILAAGAGVPMAVALGEPLAAVAEGSALLLDGDAGHVLPDSDPDTRKRAQAAIARRAAAEARALALGPAPVATRDGTPVAVQVNAGAAADAAAGMAAGADGCGLLRTEFLFLERTEPPDREEQVAAYRAVLAALPDRPVTIRLLDIGGDKPAPYLALPAEENPALGLRGVRVSLARPAMLETQLAAILSLPELARVRIMAPMVAGPDELARVRAVLDRLRDDRVVALGAMVETPAAAIAADLLAREADFLSIGSNDLTQYALAADRGNAAVAAMLDGLHPAVLRLIGETCARAGATPVSVCGGLAADPLAAPILLGLGVRTLSVPPGRVAATKALVADLSLLRAEDHARAAIACATAAEVRALARRFAEEVSP